MCLLVILFLHSFLSSAPHSHSPSPIASYFDIFNIQPFVVCILTHVYCICAFIFNLYKWRHVIGIILFLSVIIHHHGSGPIRLLCDYVVCVSATSCLFSLLVMDFHIDSYTQTPPTVLNETLVHVPKWAFVRLFLGFRLDIVCLSFIEPSAARSIISVCTILHFLSSAQYSRDPYLCKHLTFFLFFKQSHTSYLHFFDYC